MTKDEQRVDALLYPERRYWRPTTRGDCANVQRPCPYVGCRHHLYLDVYTQPDRRSTVPPSYSVTGGAEHPWDLVHSCSLDAAELDMRPVRPTATRGMTLDEIGKVLGITRERVRQIQDTALNKLKDALPELGEVTLSDLFGSEPMTPWDEMLVM